MVDNARVLLGAPRSGAAHRGLRGQRPHQRWLRHHRNPAFADGPFDIINMVVYNHQTGLTHHNPASDDFTVIGNFYRWGPSGGIGRPFWLGGSETSPTEPMFWFQDNYLDANPSQPFGAFDDPWLANQLLR